MSIGEWHRSDKQNNDEVICPNCAHQFRAIPVNVQSDLARVTAELAACKEDNERLRKKHCCHQWEKVDYGLYRCVVCAATKEGS